MRADAIAPCIDGKMSEEFEAWYAYLNWQFGLPGLIFGVSVVAQEHSAAFGALGLAAFVFQRYEKRHLFPQSFQELKRCALHDQRAVLALRDASSRFLSVRAALVRCPVFVVAYLLLCGLVSWPWMSPATTQLRGALGI